MKAQSRQHYFRATSVFFFLSVVPFELNFNRLIHHVLTFHMEKIGNRGFFFVSRSLNRHKKRSLNWLGAKYLFILSLVSCYRSLF